jgi:HEAT repeat protein
MIVKISALAQAQVAATAQNWPLVSNCLTELAVTKATATDKSQILDLALQVLIAGDFQDSWQIAKIFPLLGQMATAPLLAMLPDERLDPEVRWLLGRILGEFPSVAMADGLAAYLCQYPDSELAEIALHALVQMGPVAIDQLTTLLDTSKLSAVTALAQIRHSQTITPLLTVVDDPKPQIRYLAIEALSSFHDPRVPPLLIDRLTDVAAVVRRAAVNGLGVRSDLAAALFLVGHLSPLLLDLNPAVGQAAAIALSRIGDDPATTALFNCFQRPTCSAALCQQIVRCLGWIDRPLALQYLQIILTTTQQLALIPEAIRAIGQSQQSGTVQILTDYLRSIPPHYPVQIKQEIALVLGNLHKTVAVEEVINLLADSSEQVRWHAIYCLEQLGTDIVIPQLQRLRSAAMPQPQLLAGIEQCLLAWEQR